MTIRRLRPALLALFVAAPFFDTACAEDKVLTANAVCGDGIRQPEEDCDVKSAGCVSCKEQPGWHCRDNVCAEACGDGKVVGAEQCDPPDGKTCDPTCRKLAAKDKACDMTGAWMVRQSDFSVPKGLPNLQKSSNWYYLEITQSGDAWQVDKSLFCGIVVTGSVNVKLADAATRGLMYRNVMNASDPNRKRSGTFKEQGSGCYFDATRMYYVRGGKDTLLPADFHSTELDDPAMPPLPKPNSVYDPSKGGNLLDQAEDTDNDGFLGVSYIVTGLVSGTRNVVQRDWSSYQSDDTHVVPQFATQFTARSDFRNQEVIMHVECASGGQCPLLEAGSTASMDTPGSVIFRYLGPTWDAQPPNGIVVANPGDDADSDFMTCQNIVTALPHEPGK